jgi:DNA-binding MarR family transcriptional regulator
MARYMCDVHDEFRQLLQEFIRRFGLLAGDQTPCGKPLPTSEALALMCLLAVGEEGLAQSALVEQLAIDKSTASRLVARLGERGFVTPMSSVDDGRVRAVKLTAKGARAAKDVEDASKRRFAALLENVPAKRRRDVVLAMRDIVAALERLNANQPAEEP